jgi:hypothetical protein
VFTATAAGCGNKVTASYPMYLNIPFSSYAVTLTWDSTPLRAKIYRWDRRF